MNILTSMLSLVSPLALGAHAEPANVPIQEGLAYQRGLEEQNLADMDLQPFGDQALRAVLLTDPNSGTNAAMWRLAPGFDSGPHTHTGGYHAVVIDGVIENSYPGQATPLRLEKGGYFTVTGGSNHITKCVSQTACVFFGVLDKPSDFIPALRRQ